MSTSLNLKIDKEKVREIPLVDLAFMVLKAANTPYYYRDLMNEVAKQRGMTDEEINEFIAQLYTEINIDGRFAYVGTSLWGLKRWYPVGGAEDTMTGAKRPRIINDEDDDLEDEDFGEEEDSYNSDEDFDNSDDDQDEEDEDEDEEEEEIFDEEDSDEEVLVEEDDLEEEDLEEDEDESEDEGEFDDDSDNR
ncbi:DNA-directed RNA polymerase subunit delta [Paenibacillus xylanivorans]|uniref:Probable DNA-directed RNA polymerase subunit delta n=1 Tax=Paenibacillus xylanivorans TaxID=1705561 RepID=A0A0N0UIM0_9BACL|nr:DNA-directed RNA polymerase subunit delta [Paenibacillus xylanivorans]KOY18361.1 DNA-directed RNA polymerase subunit delta [Paenibacillus xylanivorans]